jgi:hypothetical protein
MSARMRALHRTQATVHSIGLNCRTRLDMWRRLLTVQVRAPAAAAADTACCSSLSKPASCQSRQSHLELASLHHIQL